MSGAVVNMAAVLDHNVARRPDKVILSAGERRLTNRELDLRVNALATGLRGLGVSRGDVVAVLLYNHIEFVETAFALMRLGAVLLPLNFRLSPAEWLYIVENSEAVGLVTESEFVGAVEPGLATVPSMRSRILLHGERDGWTSYDGLVDSCAGESVEIEPTAGADLQRLMYTSGTTSRPKGVQITHENVAWKNLALIVEFGLTEADRTLICGPLYHVGGLDLPGLATWHVGGSITLVRKFDAEQVVNVIEHERPSVVWLAPAMMNEIGRAHV